MIRVLAVNDPAVMAYRDADAAVLESWSEKSGCEVEFTILPWKDYAPALESSLAGSDGSYDIVMIAGHLWLQDYIERGSIQMLPGIKAAVSSYGAYEDILPEIRAEIEFQGNVWMIPSFTDGHIIFYKKDAIREIFGELLPKVMTASEYLSAVQDISNHPSWHGKSFLALKAHPSEIFLDWLPFYYGGGGDFRYEDGSLSFDAETAVGALENYLSMRRYAFSDVETYGNEEVRTALHTEECLMAVSWGGQAGFISDRRSVEDDVFGFATFASPWNVSWGFAVPAHVTISDEIEDFLGYLVSPEVDSLIGSRAGSPVRSSSYLTDAEHLPWYPVQKKMVSLSRRLPGFLGSGQIYGLFYSWIYKAFIGDLEPRTAIEGLKRDIAKKSV